MTDSHSYPEGAVVAWRWRVTSFYGWHYTTYKPDNIGANEIEPLYTAPQPVPVAQAVPSRDEIRKRLAEYDDPIDAILTLFALPSTDRATLPGHDETMANLDALSLSRPEREGQ